MNRFSFSRSDQLIAFLLASSLLILAGFKMADSDGGIRALIREPQKVNINTATLRELDTLPRIGPVLARRIIDYRQMHGSFQAIEEIVKIKGIGEKTFDKLSGLITIEDDR